MESDDLPQLLTVYRAAERLGLSHEATRRLIAAGDLPVVNVAPRGATRRSLRVSVADLKAFIATRTHQLKAQRTSRRMEQRLQALGLAGVDLDVNN